MVLNNVEGPEAKKISKGNSDTKDGDKNIEEDKPPKSKSPVPENTEQAPEVSTSTADDVVVPKKAPDEAALILSTEEEAAELSTNANEEPVNEEPKPMKVVKPKRPKKEGTKSVWVSNISRSTKAADLKKLFSENYKVESAKIVTNGKSFFGYISLETAEMVQRAVKALNGFNLAGRAISVSLMRPDLKAGRASIGEQLKHTKEKQKQFNLNEATQIPENKQEEKDESNTKIVKDLPVDVRTTIALLDSNDQTVEKKPDPPVIKTTPKEKLKKPDPQKTKPDRRDKTIEDLKKDLNTVNSELRITKRRLNDSNTRLEFERSRKLELIKEVSKLEFQLKLEKKKIIQDREQAEKKIKLDELRYEEDRTILNKELEECKKLREYLQLKVDDMRTERRHRSRSPVRSPVRRPGPNGRSLSNRGHGGADRGHGSMDKTSRSRVIHISPPKQRGYDAAQERQRNAPSPPRISKRSPLARSREGSPPYKAMKTRMDYPSSNCTSGPNGGNKASLAHYPPTNLLSAPPRNASWNSSYKMPYRYSPVPGPSAYPMIGGEVIQAPRFASTRPLEYPEYHKRVPGGPRKY